MWNFFFYEDGHGHPGHPPPCGCWATGGHVHPESATSAGPFAREDLGGGRVPRLWPEIGALPGPGPMGPRRLPAGDAIVVSQRCCCRRAGRQLLGQALRPVLVPRWTRQQQTRVRNVRSRARTRSSLPPASWRGELARQVNRSFSQRNRGSDRGGTVLNSPRINRACSVMASWQCAIIRPSIFSVCTPLGE